MRISFIGSGGNITVKMVIYAGGEFLAEASRCFLFSTKFCNLALTSDEATAPTEVQGQTSNFSH